MNWKKYNRRRRNSKRGQNRTPNRVPFSVFVAAVGCVPNCHRCPHMSGATCGFLFDIIDMSISRRELSRQEKQLVRAYLKTQKGGC